MFHLVKFRFFGHVLWSRCSKHFSFGLKNVSPLHIYKGGKSTYINAKGIREKGKVSSYFYKY